MNLQGSIVALVTPFKDGKVDETSLRGLIRWHLQQGTDGILVLGTTGEAATLEKEERKRVMEIALEEAKGKVPLIVGTGTNNTARVLEYTKLAEEMGFDAALIVTPYYNKPTQNGLYAHYSYIAKQTKIPIILYNVPGRTSVNMLPDTTAKLAEIENIIAIKEACGDIKQVTELLMRCPKDFIVLSGDDFTALATVFLGGKGVISVVANVTPKEMAALMRYALSGDIAKANELNLYLYPLYKAMFIETNPAPAKHALWLMGKIETPEVRLPLAGLTESSAEQLKKLLQEKYKLI
ncbi:MULTISPECIES: 4-hydroxy-tetrahydrodipicolinate synthase [Thermodesulfobacterium]|jgi:4-hydroxy-tetrahydrodipicolinate synthase|uniref:4-hydroxy-tetrahydrodipicolinate synthase n=2 Tax=Thermodesulfobacterium commune TaxID=1741 RepID=A0A075WVV4_9BACT|nr:MULTISPECIES: 4-hydroxy-tetrahydrodipicolinate synthase [Thermodesulfobacterium]KUJ97834.1 MAG: 4-hydroxy-tetrahydrodipicolinate synthase [Thermodesulfobacterium sp. 37_54]KUK19833.1 MAG: 4-hydroxy-tetrahydrodipicolinate synthase [Thermodesulfobacterium commune]AIH04603.1 dihydrodipicolinate synthase [Thermodesulfobacterium commune DSM 2178]KUK37948.1 MAG: 4-hydroxy-tetrahydrodipicolinate synthase [Thermodesulfobacterium commune]MBZ4682322.1 dihydrodipicolinate synthase [Thermodesulfobacter